MGGGGDESVLYILVLQIGSSDYLWVIIVKKMAFKWALRPRGSAAKTR